MKATDHLHRLVHSLSPAEKRYFQLYAQRHSSGTHHEGLYEALLLTPEYDEAAFKKEHHNKSFVRYLADEKKNLTELLLRAMRAYHSENSPDHLISNYLQDEEFFRMKRQTALQEKTIQRAKDLAYEYERWNSLLIILDREYGMRLENKQENMHQLLEELLTEQQFALQMIQKVAMLRIHRNRLFTLSRMNLEGGARLAREQFEQAMNEEVVKQHEPGTYFSCDSHYYIIHSLYHRHMRHQAEHMRFAKLAYDLYDLFPQQRKYQPAAYKIALYNYLNSCFAAGDLKPFPDLLKKARSIPASTEDEEGEDWQNLIHLQIIYSMNTAAFSELPRLEGEVNKGLKKYRHKVNKARELAICFNLACSYFMLESWDKLLDLCNRVMNDKSDARMDLKHSARLYALVAQFEMGNLETLEYLLRNEERNFKKHNTLSGATKALLDALRTLMHAPESKHRQIFAAELKKMEQLPAAEQNNIQEAIIWMQARQQHRSLVEQFKQTMIAPE